MFDLVEATRIELVSEDPSIQLSTSVFYLLRFPAQTAGKRAESESSPNTIPKYGHTKGTFTVNRRPSGSHGTLPEDGSRLKLLPVHYF